MFDTEKVHVEKLIKSGMLESRPIFFFFFFFTYSLTWSAVNFFFFCLVFSFNKLANQHNYN